MVAFGNIKVKWPSMRKTTNIHEKNLRMPRRASLFWDTDAKHLDPQKHARYIIERVLDFGNTREVDWLLKTYPSKKIRAVLNRKRSVLHEKSRALWSLVYK